MGKSSGSTKQTTEPWSGQKPHLEDLYGRAKQASITPAQYYPGTTYAGLSGTTKAGLAGMTSLAQQGSPQLDAALGAIGGIATGGVNGATRSAQNNLSALLSAQPVGPTTMNMLANQMGGGTSAQRVMANMMQGNTAGMGQLQSLMNGGGAGMGALSSIISGSDAGQKQLQSIMSGGGAGMGALNSIINGSDAGMGALSQIMQGKGTGMTTLADAAKGNLTGQNALEALIKGQGTGMQTLGSIAQGDAEGQAILRQIMGGGGAGMQSMAAGAAGQLDGQQILSQIMQGQGLGMQGLIDTAEGKFLNSNPYIDQMYDTAANRVRENFLAAEVPNTDAMFSRAGGLGGGSHYFQRAAGDDSLSRGLGDMAAQVYGQNYANERANMMQAGQFLPQIQQGAAGSLLSSMLGNAQGYEGLRSAAASDLTSSMANAGQAYSGIQQGSAGLLNDSQISAADAYSGLISNAGQAYAGLRSNAGQAYADLQNQAADAFTGNRMAAGNAYAGIQSNAANAYNSAQSAAANDLFGSQFNAAGQIANIGLQTQAQRGNLAQMLGQLGQNQTAQQLSAATSIPALMAGQYLPSQQLLAAGDILNQNKQSTINDKIGRWDFEQNELNQRIARYAQLIQGGNPGSTVTQKGGSGGGLADIGSLLLGIGAVGSAFSDRDAKEGITPIEPADALAVVQRMPVSAWRYKPEHGDPEPHIGPMAQDFQAASGLGDGKSIPVVDAMGLMFASIQALAANQAATDAKLDRLLTALEAA